jgi:transposase
MVCIKPLMHIMDKPVVRTPRRRREHSAEFKRDLVARSLQPGVSVAAIAMEGGINANLLFGWRRKHLDAMAQADDAAPRQPAAVLLPVSIETAPAQGPSPSLAPPMRPAGGAIEIEIGNARVRLRGSVNEVSLRTVLTALRSLA